MVLDMKHEINMNFFIDSFISVLRRITVSITLNDNNFTLYRKRIIFSMNDIRKALNRRMILIHLIIRYKCDLLWQKDTTVKALSKYITKCNVYSMG